MADDVSDVIEKIAERTNARDLEGRSPSTTRSRPPLEPEGD